MIDEEQYTPSQLYRYRFGAVEFDESRYELRVAGEFIEVQRKPLEVLALLMRHPNEVVTREELLRQIWGDRPTVEHVVNNALAKLRSALGLEDGARIITKPRIGYMFTGTLERLAVGRQPVSRLDFQQGACVPRREHFTLQSLLGRSAGNEVWLSINQRTGEQRVYKFCTDGESLLTLKREASLYRLLRRELADQDYFVRILDWNFEVTPFFLEYQYSGENLSQWADADGRLTGLPLHERLQLFLQIVDAVAAAHSVGVLHKDLKPANVLIIGSGSTWKIRLGDFGAGRLLDPGRALGVTQYETSGITAESELIFCTALYMAPEVLAGRTATLQSDVYSLGVMLYQFGAGHINKPMVTGWQRDVPDPMLTVDIGEATDGDPLRRLSSASVLAERLRSLPQRRLDAEQRTQQEGQSRRDQEELQKKRARRPLLISTITLLLSCVGVLTLLYYREARAKAELLHSRALLEVQANRAQFVTRFLQEEVLGETDPFNTAVAKDQTVQSAITQAIHRLDLQPPADPMTEVELRNTLARVLIKIAEPAGAETQLRRILTLQKQAGAPATQQAQSHYALAQALTLNGRLSDAELELKSGDVIADTIRPPDQRTSMQSDMSWGTFYMDQQQCSKGIPHLERALVKARMDPSIGISEIDLATLSLGQCYNGASRFNDAEQIATGMLDSLAKRPEASELTKALLESVYGEALMYQGKYAQADPILDHAYRVTLGRLGLSNLRTISILATRCNLYFMTKQLDRSLSCQRQSYDATRLRFGDKNWATWATLTNEGILHFMLHNYAEAAKILDASRVGLEATLGSGKSFTLLSQYYLAYTYLKQNQAARAESLLAGLEPQLLEEAEPGAPWALRLALLRGLLLVAQGQTAPGITMIEQTLQSLGAVDDSLDTVVADARAALKRKYQLLHN